MLRTGTHVPVQRITPRARVLGELFLLRSEATPDKTAIFEKHGASWEPMSWRGFFERASRAAAGLQKLGVHKGDRVAVLGPTKSPWAIYDMAVQILGGVGFGIYPKQTVSQIRYLLEHSDAKAVLVSSKEELDNVIEAAAGVSSLAAIVPWEEELVAEGSARDPRVVSPTKLGSADPLSKDEVRRSLDSISPKDTAILVYTSGTTGPPKGAMVSHENILTLLHATRNLTELFQDDVSLNFLPMAHAAERVFGFFARIDTGVATAYARSMGAVLEDVVDVQPSLFGSVPRIFEKAYARIQSELTKKPPAVRKLFSWAVGVGKQISKLEPGTKPSPLLRAQHLLADRLVFKKIRSAFGGRVRYFITGAAPIALEILEFFWAVGLPIYEVYGMTEATVVTHANRPSAVRLGTVGPIIEPLEQKIAEDGEILLRGPWVFQGYYKDEAATKEAIKDGWLHTGDVGTLDADGFLKITDRKKHLIITAGGKNLAPANIENAIKNQDPLISQVYAHGDRRPFVIAIVAPSPLETLAWGKERGIVTSDEVSRFTKELLENPASRSAALNAAMSKVVAMKDFSERIKEAVVRGNRDLAQVEKVRRFAVLDRDFSQEAGELTPTMKLKRKAVETLHEKAIDDVYSGGGVEV